MKKVKYPGHERSDWEEYEVDGNPLHNVFVNKKTGEKSYQDHKENKITRFDECEEHYFEVTSSNGDLECRKCQLTKRIVWGKHICKDGKIVKL